MCLLSKAQLYKLFDTEGCTSSDVLLGLCNPNLYYRGGLYDPLQDPKGMLSFKELSW